MTETPAQKWHPLGSRARRVLGVLIEKAKTTPDAYPLTLNAVVTGCNQKSNREPVLSLSQEEVEQALEDLRALGAVSEVQGSGRVSKFKHHGYEWLGVSGEEIAVMTELLLRGEQTLGDLRARAGRMATIADQAALKPVVESLLKKGLMLELTPAGRGQMVTHNLYKERELVELRARFANFVPPASSSSSAADDEPSPRAVVAASVPSVSSALATRAPAQPAITADMLAEMTVDIAELRAEVSRLRQRVDELESFVKS